MTAGGIAMFDSVIEIVHLTWALSDACKDESKLKAMSDALGYSAEKLKADVAAINGHITDVFLTPQGIEELTPGNGGKSCLYNGEHEGYEIACDECNFFLECFPDIENRE